MNILMMPALPENTSMAVNDSGGCLNRIEGESFSAYLERSRNTAVDKNERLLGVKHPQGADDELDNRISELVDDEEITTVPGLLEHMMVLLREQAEKIDNGPGDWVLALTDTGLLEKLALAAGMNEDEVDRFLQSLSSVEGEINLTGLLQDLTAHFTQMSNDTPITVPDTEFPLFAALLSKMGLSMDQVENVADQTINGQDQLDLLLLADVLSKFSQNDQMNASGEMFDSVQLRDWETQQLQSVLRQAGLSEADLAGLSLPRPGKNSSLDLPKLAELISDAVQQVQINKPQPDVKDFLVQLGQLFNEAGFKEQSIGLTPVLQNSIETIFNKLMETVDLSKVRLKVADAVQKPELETTSVVGLMMEEGLADDGDGFFTAPGEQDGQFSASAGRKNLETGVPAGLVDKKEEPVTIKFDAAAFTVAGESGSQHNLSVHELKEPLAVPRTNQAMIQQTIGQLSQAVARGAGRNEHHLIIKLYPEELGEVKINLHIRDDRISVSFAMENSRVKDILESNMQDFKNSLEKHGFNLGDLSASVDQQDKGNSQWQSFDEFSKERFWNIPKENLTDLPEDTLYRRPEWVHPESEIDLRV